MKPVAIIGPVFAMLALTVIQTSPAVADAAKGKAVFARCAVCHKAEKGAANGIGPNLFGVVGRTAGTEPGFNYSAAMKKSGIVWTGDNLKAYIKSPSTFVPGNKMTFGGISNPADTANLIDYLDTLK